MSLGPAGLSTVGSKYVRMRRRMRGTSRVQIVARFPCELLKFAVARAFKKVLRSMSSRSSSLNRLNAWFKSVLGKNGRTTGSGIPSSGIARQFWRA